MSPTTSDTRWTDGEAIREMVSRHRLVEAPYPRALDLDVTELPAADAAARILDHIDSAPRAGL